MPAFIDTASEPGAWAEAVGLTPCWIEDGHGVLVNHAFKLAKNAGARLANRDDAPGSLIVPPHCAGVSDA